MGIALSPNVEACADSGKGSRPAAFVTMRYAPLLLPGAGRARTHSYRIVPSKDATPIDLCLPASLIFCKSRQRSGTPGLGDLWIRGARCFDGHRHGVPGQAHAPISNHAPGNVGPYGIP